MNITPIMYSDSTGKYFLLDDLIAATVGFISGIIGTFVGDLVTSLFTGKWNFSTWEMYLGAAVGGAFGGFSSLYLGPIAGISIGAGLSTFFGQGLENLTGTSSRSMGDILMNSLFSAGIGAVSAGFTKFLKIPGITSGSHSYAQVWKSGLTKSIEHGFNMSSKTIAKGFVSELIKEFTLGWFISNLVQGGIEAIKINKFRPIQINKKLLINF